MSSEMLIRYEQVTKSLTEALSCITAEKLAEIQDIADHCPKINKGDFNV